MQENVITFFFKIALHSPPYSAACLRVVKNVCYYYFLFIWNIFYLCLSLERELITYFLDKDFKSSLT